MKVNRFSRRRLITKNTLSGKFFDALRTTDFATRQKFYTPIIRGKSLLKAFETKSSAVAYAKQVYIRYRKKLDVQNKLRELEQLQEGLHEEESESTDIDAAETSTRKAES